MSSSLRVNTIVPSTGTNVAIGTANGTVTFIDSVNFVLGTGSSIFSPASNTLTFGTNDAERLRITSDGKVGINQSTPQTTFHSTGTTNGQQATFGIDNSGLKISTFQKTDNDAGVILDAQKSSNGTLTFATAGTERLRIDSSGQVILNNGAGSSDATILRITGGTSGSSVIEMGDTADTDIGQIAYYQSSNAMAFRVNASEALRIASDGQVTFDKGAVGGANQVIARFQAESSRRLDIVWHDSGSLLGFDLPGSHSYIFKTAGTERVRITSSGQFKVGGSSFVVESDGDISTNVRCHGHIELDSTGSFSSPKIKLYANTGNIELDGNLIMASGNGIDFSADANASGMSSEVLDDYEEGTWTPVMNKSGVGGTAGTPSTGVGYYRKVGNLLWISFYWYKGSGGFGNNAGEWYVSGLPFLLAHGTGSGYQFIPGGYNNINGTNYQNQSNRWQSNNTNGSATLAMYGPNSTTNWTSGYAEFSASGCLMVP